MITLVAATGFTGRLVARELKALSANARIAARDKDKLSRLNRSLASQFEEVFVDVRDSASLKRALSNSKVVINCAGPFTVMGEPVVSAAVQAEAHYLDTTGEQGFIRKVFDRYGSAAAAAGIVAAPGSAFEYAIGDAAAAMLARDEEEKFDNIDVIYSVHGMYTSAGTRKSILSVLGDEPYHLRNGALSLMDPGRAITTMVVPGEGKSNAFAIPGGESLFLPLHMNVSNVSTLVAAGLPKWLLSLLSTGRHVMKNEKLRESLANIIDRQAKEPAESLRESTTFKVVARGNVGNEERTSVATGRDPYLLTAAIIARLAHHLDTVGTELRGAASPVMIGSEKLIIEATAQYGTEFARLA